MKYAILLLCLTGCATSAELDSIAQELLTVRDKLIAVEKSQDPAVIADARKSVERAAEQVDKASKTVAQRTNDVLDQVGNVITTPEAVGISGGASILVAWLLNLWRNHTRKKEKKKAPVPAPTT